MKPTLLAALALLAGAVLAADRHATLQPDTPPAAQPDPQPVTPPDAEPAAPTASTDPEHADAGESTMDPASEINRTLDDFHDAAAKADFGRYFSHWTSDSVFLGTDATERWVGEEFVEFARPHFDAGKGWAYTPRDRRVTVVGDFAYFDELLTNAKLGTCRGSGVLARRGDGWAILQYNLSIPIPNDLAEHTAAAIRLHELERGDAEDK